MRKITFMAVLFVAGTSIITVSCKKKTEDTQQTTSPPPTGVFTESFSAKIDGATYTAATITVDHNGGGLSITAVSNGKTISIQFEDNLTAGSHNLPGAMVRRKRNTLRHDRRNAGDHKPRHRSESHYRHIHNACQRF